MFTLIWIFVISSFRVYDMTLDDRLSLLTCLPNYYVPVLFALVFFCLTAFYLKENSWSIVFAILFVLYFNVTPWFIEPLRVIDTFSHFSRVSVIIEKGCIPTFQEYYFDYPGSSLLGAASLLVTGMSPLVFTKYYFPLIMTAFFYLGFSVAIRRFYGNVRLLGPSLLLTSMFGYGASHFSPAGLGAMLLPLLLWSISEWKKAFFPCFILLTIGLAVSHPTTSALLIIALAMSMTLFQIIKFTYGARMTLRTLIFIAVVLTWSTYISYTFLGNTGPFFKSVLERLFLNPHEIPERLSQPIYPILEIAIARRVFVILTSIVSAIILLKTLIKIMNRRKESYLMSYVIISAIIVTGLVLFPIYFISNEPVFALYHAFAFACFGTGAGIGILNIGSKRGFCLLLMICTLLVIPAFIMRYPVEQYNIMRDSIMHGLIFTGGHMSSRDIKVILPFGGQLRAFTSFDMWDIVQDPLYGQNLFSQIEHPLYGADYFVYRIDGLYYAVLEAEMTTIKETSYFRTYTRLLNFSSFNLIYSSVKYQIFARVARS